MHSYGNKSKQQNDMTDEQKIIYQKGCHRPQTSGNSRFQFP